MSSAFLRAVTTIAPLSISGGDTASDGSFGCGVTGPIVGSAGCAAARAPSTAVSDRSDADERASHFEIFMLFPLVSTVDKP